MTDFYLHIKNRFPYLTDDRLGELLSMGELLSLKEGEIFIKEGDMSTRLALVIEGMLRNYIINDKGEEITVVFATETQVIAPYATVFLNKPATETTVAVEPCILYAFDLSLFRQKVFTDFQFARLYIETVESQFMASIERIEDLTKKKPEQRYKRLFETNSALIERAPLKYLASYLGITPVSLSRIRKRMAGRRSQPGT